jgi:hypothetical protein
METHRNNEQVPRVIVVHETDTKEDVMINAVTKCGFVIAVLLGTLSGCVGLGENLFTCPTASPNPTVLEQKVTALRCAAGNVERLLQDAQETYQKGEETYKKGEEVYKGLKRMFQ